MQQTLRCPECGREFPTQQALQEHINRDHMGTMTESDSPLPTEGVSQERCPSCSAEFPSAESIAQHRQTAHSGEPASSV